MAFQKELDDLREEVVFLKQALLEERKFREELEERLRNEIYDLRRDLNKERVQREILGKVVSLSTPSSTTLASSSSLSDHKRRGSNPSTSSRSSRKDSIKKKDKKEEKDSHPKEDTEDKDREKEKEKEKETEKEVEGVESKTTTTTADDQEIEKEKEKEREGVSIQEEEAKNATQKKGRPGMSIPLIQKRSGSFFFRKKGSKMARGGNDSLDSKLDLVDIEDVDEEDSSETQLSSSAIGPPLSIFPSPSTPARRRKSVSVSVTPYVEPSRKQLLEKGVIIDGESAASSLGDEVVRLPCKGYCIELGTPSCVFTNNNWPNLLQLEAEDLDEPFYRTTSRDEVVTYVGEDTSGPIIISFKYSNLAQDDDTQPVYVIVHTRTASRRYTLEGSKNKKKKLGKLVTLPPKLTKVKEPRLQRDLSLFEENNLRSQRLYKFGILYCTDNQTEDEMYSNERGSPDFKEFLEFIGHSIYLKGSTVFSGGLDTKNDATGYQSVYATYQNAEIMFHVSTYLPYTSNDTQQLERKRHIGNDIVVIIFLDGDQPWSPDSFRSHFNHIFCLVRKEKPPYEKPPAKVPRRTALVQLTPRSNMSSRSTDQLYLAMKKKTPKTFFSFPTTHTTSNQVQSLGSSQTISNSQLHTQRESCSLVGRAAASLSMLLPLGRSSSAIDLPSTASPSSATSPPAVSQSPLTNIPSSPNHPIVPATAGGGVSVTVIHSSSLSEDRTSSTDDQRPAFDSSGVISPPSDSFSLLEETDSTQDLSFEDHPESEFGEPEETTGYVPGATYYRIAIVSKKVVGSFGPYITDSGIYEKGPLFREFMLSKLINGERSALRAPEFDSILTRTRYLQLQDMMRTYVPSV